MKTHGGEDTASATTADLAFIGHMCLDEVIPFGGSPRVASGSAVLCGALAAARIGTSVAVVTRMAPRTRRSSSRCGRLESRFA